MNRIHRVVGLLVGFALLPLPSFSQGKPVDYARAVALRSRYEGAAIDIAGTAAAIGRTHRFWYRKAVRGGNQFMVVDADTQQKQPAFDHAKIAQSLTIAMGKPVQALQLPFNAITFADDGAFTFNADGVGFRCVVLDSSCRKTDVVPGGGRRGQGGPRVSPDGKWEALINNHNVAIRPVGGRTVTRLSSDGSEANAYSLSSIAWSPDSKKIAAYRVRPGFRREVHYIESSPEDQIQPKSSTLVYAKPGDELDVEQPVLFQLDTKQQFIVDNTLFPNAYENSNLVWRADSRAFTFEYNQRGHQVFRIIEVDAASGKARAVISEEPKTFFTYSSKKYRFDSNDGEEVIWMSERDGWNHLYLFDGATSRVKNQITKGNWVVRGVQHVDPAARQIVFSAGGMYPGKDPYFVNYYRINFDGSGLTRLTDADANHAAAFSSDMKFYVDTYSRVDLAPIVELRRTTDNALLATLERGDTTALAQAGWKAPEVFTSAGRDGKTDIWGIIIRPSNFDPAKKYPVIENIYAGPHGSFVPKSFLLYDQMMAQAELGFIVVQIDGMGTNNRSKAFHDVAWQNLGDAGFPDRILWHKAVAAKYPYYDITRVGIYGGSAGGQNALGGLLFHPDFYSVAVSYAGCHDNRMDKIWWNEQWMGWPIGPQYSAASNVDNAYKLQGELLLIVGELDTNVDPSSTMQVVNQLIKHNKNFDLLVVPGANHPAGRGNDPTAPYGDHKRFDFFVQHLLGLTPPAWNRTTAQPPSTARPAIGENITTESGLRYAFTQQGKGPRPQAGDVMVIHGIGKFPDGKEFWNTRTEGTPYEYTPGVDRVIRGFEEGMREVREGDRVVITMKPELGYGERGNRDIPPNSTLVFDYEILAVKPLSIARLLRDGFANGTIDSALAYARSIPNLKDYYVSAASLQSLAAAADRRQAGEGEKVLAFGLTLLPDSYQLHQAVARGQSQRGAVADAIRSYETALRLNKKTTDTERKDHETATEALAKLRGQ